MTAVAAVGRAVLLSARAGHELAEPAAGHLAEQRLERFRREAAGRGRGQAGALRWEDADEMCRCAEAGGDPRGIRAVVKRRAAQAGISRRVSGHSLRVGAAQSLAERNLSVAEMQREGRWKSPSMPAYYVRNQEASRGAVARLRGRVHAKKFQKEVEIREIAVLTSINAS